MIKLECGVGRERQRAGVWFFFGGGCMCVSSRALVGAYISVRARRYARAALYRKHHAQHHFDYLNLDLVCSYYKRITNGPTGYTLANADRLNVLT